MFDRFELEGTTYYQEGRKCGKAGCHCQGDDGELHGPYWYARDDQGRRSYVGRDLPEHIARARAIHARRLDDLRAAGDRLRHELGAVTRLERREALDGDDRAILARLGFADCLVSGCSSPAAQGDLVHVLRVVDQNRAQED